MLPVVVSNVKPLPALSTVQKCLTADESHDNDFADWREIPLQALMLRGLQKPLIQRS
jgi:hypothetical protein